MYRLLIVDDEEDIRRGLAEFFPWGEIGFEVAGTAENGKQALEMVLAGGVDALIQRHPHARDVGHRAGESDVRGRAGRSASCS